MSLLKVQSARGNSLAAPLGSNLFSLDLLVVRARCSTCATCPLRHDLKIQKSKHVFLRSGMIVATHAQYTGHVVEQRASPSANRDRQVFPQNAPHVKRTSPVACRCDVNAAVLQ